MPEQVRCPSCEAALRVPDSLLGASVKCPKCQTTFTAEVAPPETFRARPEPAEERRPRRPAHDEEPPDREDFEDEDEDRPRRRRRRRRRFSSADAASDVTGPAIALMVVSGLSIIGAIIDLIFRVVQLAAGTGATVGPRGTSSYNAGYTAGAIAGGGFDLLSMLVAIVMAAGAVKMKNLQAYGLALTACILALVPVHCCCILGIPFGIWGLVVLNKAEVKDAFT